MHVTAPEHDARPERNDWFDSGAVPHRDGIHVRIGRARVMRISSSLVALSAVAILSTTLLCVLSVPAVSQTNSGSLPSVTVVAPPKEATRPHRPVQGATTGAGRRRASAAGKPAQTAVRTPPPAPGSVLAKLKELE